MKVLPTPLPGVSTENSLMWIPPGCAHAFLALADTAEVLYKKTDHWFPKYERSVRCDDSAHDIPRPLAGRRPVMAPKELAGLSLRDSEVSE